MTPQEYREKIIQMLQGKAPELNGGIPDDRLDWNGFGAVLSLYHQTSGQERNNIISAMEQIIEKAQEPPPVLAQVIHIASSLDLAQLDSSVQKLQSEQIASQEPLRSAIKDYITIRQFLTA